MHEQSSVIIQSLRYYFSKFFIRNQIEYDCQGLRLRLSSLAMIYLNIFVIFASYPSAYSSMADSPTNISQTPGNIVIEQDSVNPQIATLGNNIYTVWEEDNG